MPVLHPVTGEWCAGVGSVGVSRESRGLIAEHAGSACWWRDQVLYQREADGRAFLETNVGAIDPQGANRLCAGGDVWAAWLAGVGYRDSTGRTSDRWGLAGVGPDGTVAVVLDRETGRDLRFFASDGRATDAPGAAPDDQLVQVLGFGRAIWTEQGHRVIRSIGLPAFEFLTHVGFWLKAIEINGAWWLLYQDEHDRLIFHRAGSTTGKLIAQGNTFRPDVNAAGRAVYAINEGELPADIRTLNAFDLPDRDLRPAVVTPPPPVQPPPPPVQPPKEPTTVDVRETLAAIRDTYPKDRGLTREERGALLNAVAWAHRADGVGLQRKDGGDNVPQPRTGILIAQDILRFTGDLGRDVLTDAEGKAEPSWGDPGPADPATFVAPVEPLGAVVEPPPVNPPVDPPSGLTLEQRVKALEDDELLEALHDVVMGLVDKVRELQENAPLKALEARVLALEQRPQPVPPGLPPTVPPAPDGAATEDTLLEVAATLRELTNAVKSALGKVL